jgi:hypothetical protein
MRRLAENDRDFRGLSQDMQRRMGQLTNTSAELLDALAGNAGRARRDR